MKPTTPKDAVEIKGPQVSPAQTLGLSSQESVGFSRRGGVNLLVPALQQTLN